MPSPTGRRWWSATSAAPTPSSTTAPTAWPTTCSAVGVGPGDHVGLYLENCPEYLEAMIACFKIRAVPINVNHRYVADELEYLLDDSDSVGVLARPAAPRRDRRRAARTARGPVVRWSPATTTTPRLAAASPATGRRAATAVDDDHYVMYTGGTTGHAQGRGLAPGATPSSPASAAATRCGCTARCRRRDELPDRIGVDLTYMPLAPLMHAAAQWTSFMWFFCGAAGGADAGLARPGARVAHRRRGEACSR